MKKAKDIEVDYSNPHDTAYLGYNAGRRDFARELLAMPGGTQALLDRIREVAGND